MKRFVLITVCMASAFAMNAQDSKPATQADVNFYNGIIEGFQKAIPPNFHDWDFSIPSRDIALLEVGNEISFCEGVSCFRGNKITATYDGTQLLNEESKPLQMEVQALNASAPDYMKKLAMAMYKIENNLKLTISFCTNCDEVGSLYYCKANGYEKLTPPAGWSAYYVSSNTFSCLTDYENTSKAIEVSFFSLGLAPTSIKENKEELPYEGSLMFTLDKAKMKTYAIQNIVFKVQGSREKALEFIKRVDLSILKSLMTK